MSECDSIRRLLHGDLDRKINADDAHRLNLHLEKCAACRRYREQLGSLRTLIGQTGDILEAEGKEIDLWPQIRQRIEKKEGRGPLIRFPVFRRFRPVWIGAAVSAAAACILFAAGVFGPENLPANYCRIESINAPSNDLMIYQDKDDGLTIIWLME